jgi:hypothetical protein
LNALSIVFQVFGLVFDFVGALLFADGTIKSKKQIEQISGTYVGKNPNLERSLLEDRKLGFAGLAFLCLGFFLQMLGVISAV